MGCSTTNITKKRTELHLHTKMSEMSGLIEVEDVFKSAKDYGISAIAITDNHSVQSFSQAFEASIKFGIKAIYGTDIYVLNDNEACGLTTYHIVILVKEQSGIKNLYKIISSLIKNESNDRCYINKSDLLNKREGLLIGCILADSEGKEASIAVVEKYPKEIDFCDYIEIQPIGVHRGLNHTTTKSVVELQKYNRRIVSFAEKQNIPVIASCNAHYLNEEDEICRKILLSYKNQFKDTDRRIYDENLYLRTTDDMLLEFSYLGEEKAHEIVISNTNLISEMIQHIKPFPDNKYLPGTTDESEKLVKKCNARANQIYGTDIPDHIKERLNNEIRYIIDNDYASYYILAEKLVKYGKVQGGIVYVKGFLKNSIVSYLLGITDTMPIEECLPSVPEVDIRISNNIYKQVIQYLHHLFGEDNVFHCGEVNKFAKLTSLTLCNFVDEYSSSKELNLDEEEKKRIINICQGVKQYTRGDVGCYLVVPQGYDIYDFTPIQYELFRPEKNIITHFTTDVLKNFLLVFFLGFFDQESYNPI